LFQHQSSIDEGEETEPSWILGAQPGPYIPELSRSIFTHLGRSIAFLGLDCRTERTYDEVVSPETYDKVLDRLEKSIIKGETKHLIVLLGIPIAYPRMVWLENM
jgi:PhoD related phosphatase